MSHTPLLHSDSIVLPDGLLSPRARARASIRQPKPSHHRLRTMLKARTSCLVAATVLLGAILVMALLYTPAPPDLTEQSADLSTVSGWAAKAEACSGGGTAKDLAVNVSAADGRMLRYTCEAPQLSWESYATAGITVVALLFMVNNSPPDVVMLSATVCLLLLRIINQTDAWSGFSTPGVMAVAVLFIVAQGLQEVGVVDVLLRSVLGAPTSLFVAQIRLLFPVAVISAFMNNTPVVAMMIPIVDAWSTRIGIPKSKFLIPLSFASMLGGCCSLIGTSTNLILAALILKDDPTQVCVCVCVCRWDVVCGAHAAAPGFRDRRSACST